MTDPLLMLRARLERAVAAAFPEHAGVDPMIRRSDRADYQANAAMGLAKKVGRPPREVAAKILEHLDASDVCESVEVSGPGFLNLVLRPDAVASSLRAAAGDQTLGLTPPARPETVVIDYSAPNVAKEMHVGHLRSTIIGDALARVFEQLGHRVVRQNHVGDWGTPFGMLIEHLIDRGEGEGGREGRGDESASVGDLGAFYKEARAKFDADESFAERARRRVVALQASDEATLALWRKLVAISRAYFEDVYARLGVTLGDADVCGESFYNAMLPEVVRDLVDKGLAIEDDGAICVFPPGFAGKEGEPLPLIVRKQDGGYGYAATDLAAVRHRVGTLKADRILYVVGAPQQQHLAMVLAVAKMAGWLPDRVSVAHVAFGSVLGADKKMFKTRSGETVRLLDLLTEASERAERAIAEKAQDLDPAERERVARQVGIGAVKYADLSSDRIKDYVFDFDRMLAFEGNTAPYLQYAHARIRSIFRKLPAGDAVDPAAVAIAHPTERLLGLELLGFPGVAADVARTLKPHELCTYLYALASRFTSFYEACPVLRAEREEERRSRLVLCDLTARTLARGLGLLGIEAPERM